MLLHVFDWLAQYYGAFRVFSYLTLRAILAALTALAISLLVGPWMIRQLAAGQIGQVVRSDGPQTHLGKRGTPTMGGALILVAMLAATLAWGDLGNRHIWIALGVTAAFGLIGFYDDYLKLVVRDPRGLAARWKYLWQSVAGLGAALALWYTAITPAETSLYVPFFKQFAQPLSIGGFVLFVYFVIVGSSNAVNLTDGLDGLAIGLVLIVSATYMIFSYITGNAVIADYLKITLVRGAGELTIFCGAMVGASMGFLWYNSHPAQIFMGDVGSLALGGSLGAVAIITKHEVLLAVVGGVFVVEALSVILQVGSYKLRRKRIFKMAPIHHHFELLGWAESKVIVRFWIVGVIFALLAISTLKLR
jgi:phospho-N-acetylmuramoyl-pentapeptide-transferase